MAKNTGEAKAKAFFCAEHGKGYSDRRGLQRHIDDKHPKEGLEAGEDTAPEGAAPETELAPRDAALVKLAAAIESDSPRILILTLEESLTAAGHIFFVTDEGPEGGPAVASGDPGISGQWVSGDSREDAFAHWEAAYRSGALDEGEGA